MKKICEQCGNNYQVQNFEQKLLKKVSPIIGNKRYVLPVPNKCVNCREQIRLAYRNEKTLYKRKCDLCEKTMISIYDKNTKHPVYCQECFWSDKWNPYDYGIDYDFDKSFFEQFQGLLNVVPRLALVNKQSENSEYCNYSFANKNCYLTFGNHYEEDCMYGRYSTKNKDCLDYFWLYGSELCYECVFSKNCYKSIHLDHCEDTSESYFCYDLKGCKNCLFSHGLRNKQYFIFNKKSSKEDYEDYFKRLRLGSYKQWDKLKKGWERYKKSVAIFRDNYQSNCENCQGNNLQNSKNLYHSFSCTNCEDCIYGFQMDETYDSMDNSHMGYDKCEVCYNDIGCSGIVNCVCCDSCWHGSELIYCNLCFSAKNCFGCIGMKHNEFSILNKKYTEDEYKTLVSRIIENMMKIDEWGSFYPFSPFNYNETVAQEYFPLDEENAQKNGFLWKDEIKDDLSGETLEELTDKIKDVNESILNKTLICESTGKPFKIQPSELEFYKKMDIPIPRFSPDKRQMDRLFLANPWKLWKRNCEKCEKEVITSYNPRRPETIYCEKCYLKEVY